MSAPTVPTPPIPRSSWLTPRRRKAILTRTVLYLLLAVAGMPDTGAGHVAVG